MRQNMTEKEDLMRVMPENAAVLALGLAVLSSVQEIVSSAVPGAIPEPGISVTKDNFRAYTLALIVEISEFAQEFDYKSWSNNSNLLRVKDSSSKERVLDEFADILAFLGVLLVYMERMGFSTRAIAEAYAYKTKVNMERLSRFEK